MPPPPGSAQRPSPHTCPPVRAPRTVTEGVSGRRGLKRRGSSGGAGILLPQERRPPAAPRTASPGSGPRRGRLARGWQGRPDSTAPCPWRVNRGRRGPGLRGLRLAPASRSCGAWEVVSQHLHPVRRHFHFHRRPKLLRLALDLAFYKLESAIFFFFKESMHGTRH